MRLVVRIVVFLGTLAVLAAAGMFLHLRRSLPVLEGEIAVPGLAARVEILRDPYGIPHIFAASVEDAQFALGFAHAQDRLWQMEMNRRIGSGRLAELLGPRALEADRFLRTLGVRRVAEANLRRYDKETLALLEAYAAGVNAFLDTGPVLPPEFWLLRASPEPWTPADTCGVDEDDGLGPRRQLAQRAAAPAHVEDAVARARGGVLPALPRRCGDQAPGVAFEKGVRTLFPGCRCRSDGA